MGVKSLHALNSLFDVPSTQRPKRTDKAVTDQAVALLLAGLTRDRVELGEDEAGIIKDFKDTYERGRFGGYEFAKELERKLWEIDESLASALQDHVPNAANKAFDAALKSWVDVNGVRPALKNGTRVRINLWLRGQKSGEITAGGVGATEPYYVDCASYSVFVESEGHVREGIGTRGWVVPFESCDEIVTSVYTIYDSPADHPGKFVVRPHHVLRSDDPTVVGVPWPDPVAHAIVDTLEAARASIPAGLVCIGRAEQDVVCVVESWV